jgi:hypothetical protein
MPKLNGIEATRRIKELHPQAAVIGLSFHHDELLIAAMKEAGAAAYMESASLAQRRFMAPSIAQGLVRPLQCKAAITEQQNQGPGDRHQQGADIEIDRRRSIGANEAADEGAARADDNRHKYSPSLRAGHYQFCDGPGDQSEQDS